MSVPSDLATLLVPMQRKTQGWSETLVPPSVISLWPCLTRCVLTGGGAEGWTVSDLWSGQGCTPAAFPVGPGGPWWTLGDFRGGFNQAAGLPACADGTKFTFLGRPVNLGAGRAGVITSLSRRHICRNPVPRRPSPRFPHLLVGSNHDSSKCEEQL